MIKATSYPNHRSEKHNLRGACSEVAPPTPPPPLPLFKALPSGLTSSSLLFQGQTSNHYMSLTTLDDWCVSYLTLVAIMQTPSPPRSISLSSYQASLATETKHEIYVGKFHRVYRIHRFAFKHKLQLFSCVCLRLKLAACRWKSVIQV